MAVVYYGLLTLLAIAFLAPSTSTEDSKLSKIRIQEISVRDIQVAFKQNKLTSKQLVEFYTKQIQLLNPTLKSVLEINPDALHQADKADKERKAKVPISLSNIHGIPILLKDNIATKDRLNTTAGSYALLGSVVPHDAGVVEKLRKAGAIILGKASLSEWSHYRSTIAAPGGWCARGGQAVNPYVASARPCGSSSGSAISVAANMVTVSLGTETDGSILCPSSRNSVVGIKPTLGLTSRSGVVPITPRQDTVGPICRTVADAVYVLDAIVGFDSNDAETKNSLKYIPSGGYSQFLKYDGLRGKRLLMTHYPGFGFSNNSSVVFAPHLRKLRQKGAILIENLEIPNLIEYYNSSGEDTAVLHEFKLAINAYLKDLVISPVRSLTDLIKFNRKFSALEKLKDYQQDLFLAADATNGTHDTAYKTAILNIKKLNEGYEKMMRDNKVDAFVTPNPNCSPVLAIGGHPGITVPAGYDTKGVPLGICFGGVKGSEPILIEIAYGFEQATKSREPPKFKP